MPSQPMTKLANIKFGLAQSKKVAILHQETDGAKATPIHSAFPKDLAMAFSGYVARAFKPVQQSEAPVAEIQSESDLSVTIKGGKFHVVYEIFKWIFECGQAGKIIPFSWLKSPAFHNYSLVLLACEELEIDSLKGQVLIRMRDIAKVQVHSTDVERVFSSFDGPHRDKDMVCQSIGQALWDGRLKAYPAYQALFRQREYQEFKNGTDAVYEKLQRQYFKTPEGKAAKKEHDAKTALAKPKQETTKTGRTEIVRDTIAKSHGVAPDRVTLTGNGRYTLSADAQPVRNGQGGRPRFVKVGLGSLGVTPQQFRPAEARPASRKTGKAPHAKAAAAKTGVDADSGSQGSPESDKAEVGKSED